MSCVAKFECYVLAFYNKLLPSGVAFSKDRRMKYMAIKPYGNLHKMQLKTSNLSVEYPLSLLKNGIRGACCTERMDSS